MNVDTMTDTARLTFEDKEVELPVVRGSEGEVLLKLGGLLWVFLVLAFRRHTPIRRLIESCPLGIKKTGAFFLFSCFLYNVVGFMVFYYSKMVN